VLGPAFGHDEIPDVISTLLNVYVENRHDEEIFIDTYNRIGLQPFKERIYAK
jgi:sulfite reductase (NADPH) hemoprotein beta-component